MIRLILSISLFLFSLLAVFPIPARLLWYPAIAVSEFPWIWIIASLLLVLWLSLNPRYRAAGLTITVASLIFFSMPIVEAARIGKTLDARLYHAFGITNADMTTPHRERPFTLLQMVTGIGAKKVPFTTYEYAVHSGVHLQLNFYPSQIPGIRPCLLVVHGGSWKSGNNSELPDVDSYFARAGYQVATINYRLAPEFRSPAPQEDVHSAIVWLQQNARGLSIQPDNFVLLGRSAGGQIVLEAAYGLNDPSVKGVVSFYGPADMVFGYQEPHNQLVMRNREVLEGFIGGTPEQLMQKYIEASPIAHVRRGSVPALLVHGLIDQHVHYSESVRMEKRLADLGVPHLLLSLPWATHGCEYTLNGPSGQLSMYAAERFLFAVTQMGRKLQ